MQSKLNATASLLIFSIFPGRWSISPRGETSWNTKRRCRQKASHPLRDPSSPPNHWTADRQILTDFQPYSDQAQRSRTWERSVLTLLWTEYLNFTFIVIYLYRDTSCIKKPHVSRDRMSDLFENCLSFPPLKLGASPLVWDVWSTVSEPVLTCNVVTVDTLHYFYFWNLK